MILGDDQERVYFAGNLDSPVGALLDQANEFWAETEKAEAFLLEAQKLAPTALPVYFSLYKFYFYKGDLEKAEITVMGALKTASALGGFAEDWSVQAQDSASWGSHDSPAHFYLFSLKALAFIRLRRGDHETSHAILAKLRILDPQDTIGSGVIATIADSILH